MKKEQVENINPIYPKKSNMPSLMIKPIVQLIQQQSINVIWEQAFKCPCINIQTGQPQPNCKVCHGQGWVYLHPRSIDMAIQGDRKNFMLNQDGASQMGTSIATPQITVNGVEQGIKPGDRLTVSGWTTNESYTFNVTQSRLTNGTFIPYDVKSINEAYIIKNDDLVSLDLAQDLELDGNFVKILNPDLINETITLSLEIIKRFYVISLSKELRYQNYYKLADKEWATGNGAGGSQEATQGVSSSSPSTSTTITHNGSETLTEHTTTISGNEYPLDDGNGKDDSDNGTRLQRYPQVVNRDGEKIVIGKHQIYRLPPLLVIRRENLYFSNINLVSSESDNNSVIKDPRVSDFNDFING